MIVRAVGGARVQPGIRPPFSLPMPCPTPPPPLVPYRLSINSLHSSHTWHGSSHVVMTSRPCCCVCVFFCCFPASSRCSFVAVRGHFCLGGLWGGGLRRTFGGSVWKATSYDIKKIPSKAYYSNKHRKRQSPTGLPIEPSVRGLESILELLHGSGSFQSPSPQLLLFNFY